MVVVDSSKLSAEDSKLIKDIRGQGSVSNETFVSGDPNAAVRTSKLGDALKHYKFAYATANNPKGNEVLLDTDLFKSPHTATPSLLMKVLDKKIISIFLEMCKKTLGEDINLNLTQVPIYKRARVFGNELTSSLWGGENNKHPSKALVLVR